MTEMDVPQFLRIYQVRAPRLMWLLGAGASSSAGVPTAYDVVWRLKRRIYCSEHRRPERTLQDLQDPHVRARLQAYFDATGRYPPEDDPSEYAHYFEAAYPDEQDRRRFLEGFLSAATPSWGHSATAALMAADVLRVVWTTNFDRLIEEGSARIPGGVSTLRVADLTAPDKAADALRDETWPLLIKLHGDFHYRRLKNTTEELRSQDAVLRDALVDSTRRFGFVVMGYSGRDRSVMDSLRAGIHAGQGYPSGLFWILREGSALHPAVSAFIEEARAAGIEAHLISGPTFDELASDICQTFDASSELLEAAAGSRRPLVSDAPLSSPGRDWPTIRLNAYPVSTWPQVCRLVKCSAGGTKEVREALKAKGFDAVAIRKSVGVVGFGRDEHFREAFGDTGFSGLDLHPIPQLSAEYLGLLTDALGVALARERPIVVEQVGRNLFGRVAPDETSNPAYSQLRKSTRGSLHGSLPVSGHAWYEAVRLRLEERLDRLWLLTEPTVFVADLQEADDTVRSEAREFGRERMAGRYNRHWNDLLEGWGSLLLGGRDGVTLRAYGTTSGLDAEFGIDGVSAFSRRAAP